MTGEYKAYYKSPIGMLEITGDEESIFSIDFVEENGGTTAEIPQSIRECLRQLEEYFSGKRREFSLKLKPEGTGFQKRVWKELEKIPYGRTCSYADIAKAVGNEKGMRAVGNANGRNPIPIIVPCHRVIGSNGKLTGYAGGLWRKEWLLKHEGAEFK